MVIQTNGLQESRQIELVERKYRSCIREYSRGTKSYCTMKFRFSDYSSYLGDNIYMRAEELLSFTEAEALCHLKI